MFLKRKDELKKQQYKAIYRSLHSGNVKSFIVAEPTEALGNFLQERENIWETYVLVSVTPLNELDEHYCSQNNTYDDCEEAEEHLTRIDNMICNRSENMNLLIPYVDKPVYIKGFCWNKKFDGWVIIYYDYNGVISCNNLLFDYQGHTYSVYGFLPSRFTMNTSSSYNNAIYKEQPNN